MLQIDENQHQVYSCSFNLNIKQVTIPLKSKQICFYVQWKVKQCGNGSKTDMQKIDKQGIVSFDQTLKVHTELLKNIQTDCFLKKYSQLTVFLISSKKAGRPKILGSMLIGLHQILNDNKFQELQQHKLTYSPLDIDVEFQCQATQCQTSSILQANLDSALFAEQSLLFRHGGSLSRIRDQQDKIKERITKHYLTEDDSISQGGFSFFRLDMDESTESREHQVSQRRSLLLESAIKVSEPFYEEISPITHPQDNFANLNYSQQQLLSENKNLKKLLLISKNEKKIEVQRLEDEIRDLVHQIAQKQTQLLKLQEQKQLGNSKVGELLDKADCSHQKWGQLKRENQQLTMALQLQRQMNSQLTSNYQSIDNRLQVVKDWEQERKFLISKISDLEEENEMIKVQYFDLENKIYLKDESYKASLNEYKLRIEELETQLIEKESKIDLITSKVAKFEQQLDKIQTDQEQDQMIHRVEYFSSEVNSTKSTSETESYVTRKTYGSRQKSIINIVEENSQLKNIKEEDLEQSLPSIDAYHKDEAEKQITTTSDLADHGDAQFYRKILCKTQKELDQLRLLYRDRDSIVMKERNTNRSLFEELERLRFEFLYQLSKVTKSLNQKLFEIKKLREQNMRLRSDNYTKYEQQIVRLQKEMDQLQEEKLTYFDRCFRLEEQNLALINLNRQKQDIYQSILKDPYGQNQDRDMIVKEFTRLIQIMFNNRPAYINILTNYGFTEEEYLKRIINKQPSSIIFTKQKSNMSDIIDQLNIDEQNSPEKSASCVPSLQSNQDLLLQSKTTNIMKSSHSSSQGVQVSQYLKKMCGELTKLKNDRQEGLSFIKQLASKGQAKYLDQFGPQLQTIKTYVIRYCGRDHQMGLLKLVRDLETILSSTCSI